MPICFAHLREKGANTSMTLRDLICKTIENFNFIVVFIVKGTLTFSEWTWKIRCVTRT